MKFDMELPAWRIETARAGGFWQDQTTLDYLDRNLATQPDRTAVVDYNNMTGRSTRLTYREIDAAAARIAAGLARRGVMRGDVVAVQLPNWWQMIALHLASLRLGAIFNPLMPIFRSRELSFMLALAETKVIVVPERFRDCNHAEMLTDLRPQLPQLQHVLVIGTDGHGSFEAMLEEEPEDEEALLPSRRALPDEVMLLLFTSGTTGEPKGVMHTSNTAYANVFQARELLGFSDADVTLASLPLAHSFGFLYGILNPIFTGAKVVLQDIWNPKEAVGLVARENVTFSMGPPPFLADLIDAAENRRDELRSLQLFIAGGAPIPRTLVRRAVEDFGIRVSPLWGMSENGPVVFIRPGDPLEKVLETDGRVVVGMEVKIVNPSGHPVATGTAGRLLVRGPGMFVGYLKRPQWNATDAEGWFDTGDLACQDSDGYVRITGRSKDVIIRGGENIPVVEIENLIYQHPAVAEVAIVAMPDPRLNERACAFVVLRQGKSLTLSELSQHLLARHCTKNYLPERLEIVESFPRTPSGKIQKFKLRERARELAP